MFFVLKFIYVQLSNKLKMMHDEYDERTSYQKNPRSGLIPFHRGDDGKLSFLMMVAANPILGGPLPMISKGKIEHGEDAFQCAIREAEEELGLEQRNMKTIPELIAEELVVLRSGQYKLTVYAVEVFNRWDFTIWSDETEYTLWMTLDEFKADGRRDHYKFLEMVEQHANENFGNQRVW